MVEDPQLLADLEPVEVGQLDVEQNEIGLELASGAKGLDRVLGLAHDLVSLCLEQRPDAGSKAGVVVDDEDCHAHIFVRRGLGPNTVSHTLFKRRL